MFMMSSFLCIKCLEIMIRNILLHFTHKNCMNKVGDKVQLNWKLVDVNLSDSLDCNTDLQFLLGM